MLYLAIIYRLYIKRNDKGRRLAIPLIVYRTLILGYALYMSVVILLYSVLCARALINNTKYCQKGD